MNIQDEVEQVKGELNRIAETTEFNGRKLTDTENDLLGS